MKVIIHPFDQQLQRHQVMPALRDDQVGLALARLDELLVHRFDSGQVLVDNAVQRAPALLDVADDAAQDAHIGVGVHKDLHVH